MLVAILAITVAMVVLTHTAPFPFLLDAAGPATAHWSMPVVAGTPTVYLTFDDGPNPTATPQLLDVLAEQDAVATFFVIDRHVTPETAPLVDRMVREGHGVALHTHRRGLATLPAARIAEEVVAMADRIERVSGHRPCPAFRPHGGWRSDAMFVALDQIDTVLVGWGWGLWDWDWFRRPDPDRLAGRLAGRVDDGSIVVIHDGHHEDPRSDRRYAWEAAARLVPAIRERGFVLGRIC